MTRTDIDTEHKSMIAGELEYFADALRQYAINDETRGYQGILNDAAYTLASVAAEMRAEMAKQAAL